MVDVFDGRIFEIVAERLRVLPTDSDTSEAFFRTAIGRAYYSCFHAYRQKHFPSRTWYVPRGKGKKGKYVGHGELRREVRRVGLGVTADKLDTLIELREHADYHSWPPSRPAARVAPPTCYCSWGPNVQDNCDLAIDLARSLLADLDKTGDPGGMETRQVRGEQK